MRAVPLGAEGRTQVQCGALPTVSDTQSVWLNGRMNERWLEPAPVCAAGTALGHARQLMNNWLVQMHYFSPGWCGSVD